MTDTITIDNEVKRLANDVASRIDTSHAKVIDVLIDTHLVTLNMGLDINTHTITQEGKTMIGDYMLVTDVVTTNEKVSTITTQAMLDNVVVSEIVLVNTANDDGACKWEEKSN